MQTRFHPYWHIIIAATIGAFGGLVTKQLALPATTISFFRLAVPVIILFFSVKKQHALRHKPYDKSMLLASLLNAIRVGLYFFAFLYTSISNAVIMLYTWPIFASLFSMIFLKESITKKKMFLLVLAFVGIICMYATFPFHLSYRDAIGMAAMLVSAALFAFTVVIFKKQLATYSNTETIFYQNLVGTIVFLPFLFIHHPFPTVPQIGVISLYSFLIGIVGFFLIFSALKKITVVEYAILSYWEVIAGVLVGMVFLHETLTWNMVLGGSLIILAGIGLAQKRLSQS